jgi:hypothetical protein
MSTILFEVGDLTERLDLDFSFSGFQPNCQLYTSLKIPDFSCYTTVVVNNCSKPLTLTQETVNEGYWKIPPPFQVKAGEQFQFVLADIFGL